MNVTSYLGMVLLGLASFTQANWNAVVSTEGAAATMTPIVSVETPVADVEVYGGPLDTLKNAKELIEKGNVLADRGKAILDQAEVDGKISIDVILPQPPPTYELAQANTSCIVDVQGNMVCGVPTTTYVQTPYAEVTVESHQREWRLGNRIRTWNQNRPRILRRVFSRIFRRH